ncbi:MAG: glycosyltransferase family 9 protein, partial [Chloroflexota bacterium]
MREGMPDARVSILVPPRSAEVIEGSSLVDHIVTFDKFRFDNPLNSLTPGAFAAAATLLGRLRKGKFDAVAIMHHLTTRWGTMKYAALALCSGAPERVGLDNGRGWFLTGRMPDLGFGEKHEAEYWLDVAGLLGAKVADYPMEITLRPEDEAFAEKHLPNPSGRPTIALHPGSGEFSLARRWPSDRFAQVAQSLVQRHDAQLVMVGSTNERALAEEVARNVQPPPTNLAGKTTVRQLAAILKLCHLFVGNDSGVMHLAAAVGTPVVAIFGPSNHRAWGPWLGNGFDRAEVVRVDIPCSPCLYVDGRVGNRNGCLALDCQNLVTPEMVLAATERLLKSHE